MSLTLYTSIGWAVEKQTITDGGGLTGPILLSAVSTDPNTVRLTFDRKLMLEYRQFGVYRAATLDCASFQIIKLADSSPLAVVRTVWIDDTHIDLGTENQDTASYRVTTVPGGVMDFQGNTITLQMVGFTGQQKADYLSPATIRSFTSGYGGMQEDEATDFYPDLAAPYLANRNPNAGDMDISRYTNVLLDVLDDYTGVDLSTVRIWVNGTLAYRGDLDLFLAPYDGPASARTAVPLGHHFVIDYTGVYGDYALVPIVVEAYDQAPISNFLSTSYSFRTVDESIPYLANLNPPASSVDQPRATDISLDILDNGAGVDAATVWIKVNGTYAWHLEAAQPGFSVTRTVLSNGYRYLIDPDSNFTSYQVVTIAAYAKDLRVPPNTMDTSYVFRTVDTEPPYVGYRNPAPDDVDVTVWHTVTLDLADAGSGINVNSVVITIEGTTVWENDLPKPGYEGSAKTPIAGGYRYVIQHTIPFLVEHLTTVEVDCNDVSGNPFAVSYSFTTESGAGPRIAEMYPAPDQVNIPATASITFQITDAVLDLNPDTVLCVIDDVTAYENQTQKNGFVVVRTPILGGYAYQVTPLIEFAWSKTVSVFLFAADYSGATDMKAYTFDVALSSQCFTGPLTTFEEKLLESFATKYPYLELMRLSLLEHYVKLNSLVAARAIYLKGHEHELAIVLRDMVPTPTDEMLAALLCKRQSLLTIANLIPDRMVWLEGSLAELTALGVPTEHLRLIRSYVGAADEARSVLLMSFVVLLAKALE